MTPGTLVKFNFRGDSLNVVALPDGDVGVALRPLCEDVFGIDFTVERNRLARAAKAGARWAAVVVVTVGADEVLVLPRASIPMFAATVHGSSVRADRRAKLVAYQNDAAEVLAEQFLPARFTMEHPAAPAPPGLTADEVRAVVREELREASAAPALRPALPLVTEHLARIPMSPFLRGALTTIASKVDPGTGLCDYSYRELAAACGVSRNTMIQYVLKLEALGCLRRDNTAKTRHGGPNAVRLALRVPATPG